jgi:hypothetical protein
MQDGQAMGRQGMALAAVQFFFTLGWTLYVIYLPGLLKEAGIALIWLPWLLMADQLIFAAMDIAFGVAADRARQAYQLLARLLLVLTTVSSIAFLLLPMAGAVSPVALLCLLGLWVITASVVRAPTLILLAKQAKPVDQGKLVIWYAGGMALASALSPFLGLWLKGVNPHLPFAVSAIVLVLAVLALLRLTGAATAAVSDELPKPLSFPVYMPMLVVLGVAVFGFQWHAFVNAGPLYLKFVGADDVPWLMPLLWVGFAFALVPVGAMVKRFGALPVAAGGILLVALASRGVVTVDALAALILLQLLAGAGWALAFAGLMESASLAGTRGAEGLFMGSFFAVTALASFARIGVATQWAPLWQDIRWELPTALLLAAGLAAAAYAILRAKSGGPRPLA